MQKKAKEEYEEELGREEGRTDKKTKEKYEDEGMTIRETALWVKGNVQKETWRNTLGQHGSDTKKQKRKKANWKKKKSKKKTKYNKK